MVIKNICNVPVSCPLEPYSSQMSMMTRMIKSLNRKENCLLELPTGSGKTMALLCAALAWHRNNVSIDFSKDPEYSDNQKPKKIYFGSRTHKQIGQIVRELKKTEYADIKMSILSGRKQSCVNSVVLNSKNIDETCKSLCKTTEGCLYKVNDKPCPNTPFDIENIKPILAEKKICPYYQMKNWCAEAILILCPYNYILNPQIRKSMGIDLKDSIVILDEAHNIEDICREAYSMSISQEDLNNMFNELARTRGDDELLRFTKSLDNMIKFMSERLFYKDEDILKKIWSPDDFIAIMKKFNIDWNNVKNLKNYLQQLSQEANSESFNIPVPNMSLLTLLESFLTVVQFILNDKEEFRSDFSIIVTEGREFEQEISSEYLNKFKRKSAVLKNNFILNLWCMNPGIVFKQISELTHSVILASGTLSPMTSYERELNCKFHSTLEAPHVIKKEQVFIASVGEGPKRLPLQAVYSNTKCTSFQDELGRVILSCCQIVPSGILCFLSSFSLMNSLIDRWKTTSLLKEIEAHKTIFTEPRNNIDMDDCMRDYYESVERGALLFAVYRGKASEGINFSDNAARLVITVGIPYPMAMDPKILLKKNYNTLLHQQSKNKENNYLSGGEWYNIQAYRALNQAIGRCIRHKNDWGAMLMVDARFADSKYASGLCKWIQHKRNHYINWAEMFHNMQLFFDGHKLKTEDPV